MPGNRHFIVVCRWNTRTHFGHICGTRDAARRLATPLDTALQAERRAPGTRKALLRRIDRSLIRRDPDHLFVERWSPLGVRARESRDLRPRLRTRHPRRHRRHTAPHAPAWGGRPCELSPISQARRVANHLNDGSVRRGAHQQSCPPRSRRPSRRSPSRLRPRAEAPAERPRRRISVPVRRRSPYPWRRHYAAFFRDWRAAVPPHRLMHAETTVKGGTRSPWSATSTTG